MLRRLIFALVLVGAAFAGGAAINGPGLAWLQRSLLGGRTIIVDGRPSTPPGSPKPPKPFPTAKAAPLAVDLPNPPPEPKKEPDVGGPPALAGSPVPPPPPASPPAPDLAPIGPAETPDPAPSVAQGPPVRPGLILPASAKADPVARRTSADAPAGASVARDWSEIRKRLRELGVARYTIDAETDGRVRFSCVIPVNGLRAVGHQFEAEGDDEYQAADAALRRVALWQATEAN